MSEKEKAAGAKLQSAWQWSATEQKIINNLHW